MKRMRDELVNPIGAINTPYPFGALRVDLAVIHFLEGLALHHIGSYLTNQNNHRGRVLVGRMNSNESISSPRPAGDHHDPRFAGQLSIGLCHIRSATLLPAGDKT